MAMFEKNEIVVFASGGEVNPDPHPFKNGDELRIDNVLSQNSHPSMAPDTQYYLISGFGVMEAHLRKRPNPSQSREQEDARKRHLAGCRETLAFNELMTELKPVTEETVKRVMENMGRLYGA